VQRQTFIVQVHPDRVVTLENLGSRERIRVADLATVGAQIERWLDVVGTGAATMNPGHEVGVERDGERE
jgi:hypothetical protein